MNKWWKFKQTSNILTNFGGGARTELAGIYENTQNACHSTVFGVILNAGKRCLVILTVVKALGPDNDNTIALDTEIYMTLTGHFMRKR